MKVVKAQIMTALSILSLNFLKKNKANYFSIGFGTPRWMNRLDFNGYEEVKWQYNFLESTVS